MKKKVVIALGHRALGTTFPEQQVAVKNSAKVLADLVEAGCQLIITHSNAPQVGMIHTAMNEFAHFHTDYTGAPMSVCSAMSQGYIGYDIQNALREELLKRSITTPVSTILTQVLVDPYDEAMYHPVKVIGRYMTKEEALKEEEKGNYVVEETGGRYRRIVSAPKPLKIIEIDAINALVDAGQMVVACGGGGIPVMEQNHSLKGASAIIEKDYAAGKLAEMTDADVLLIITNDEFVDIDIHTDHPVSLGKITVSEAGEHIEKGQFGKAAMLPKIQASVDFVSQKAGREAIITNLEHALDAIEGKTGTVITQ
ncbi:MAG: carbamate kinase [Eubacteriales bacterium]|nr:carbamate kinase [Eubacteriales bacterium]